MADFNPIRDLRSPEADPFNVPAGQSTQEVEDIRLRLVLTREKTENVVKIIKNKGLTFKKDIEKIQELQRRLRTTIPRIPILRGDASTQIGSQVGVQKRGMSGLDFSRFFTSTKTATKTSFPLLDVIITAIVFALTRGKVKNKVTTNNKAVNKIIEFIRGKQKIKQKIVPFQRTKKGQGTVIQGDASQQTVDVDFEVVSDEPILTRLANIFKTRKLKKFSKEKGFAKFSKDADKLKMKTKIPFELRPLDTKLEVNRYVSQLQRATTGKTKFKFGEEGSSIKFSKIETLFAQNRADLKIMLAQRERQLKNLTPGTEDYKSMQKSIRLVENGIKRMNKSFQDYVKEVKNRAKTRIRLEEKDEKILEKYILRKIIEGEYYESLDDAGKKLYKEMVDKGDEFLDLLKGFGPGASINAKPMSNDIAMLNTNTGYRKTVVIAVDSDSIG